MTELVYPLEIAPLYRGSGSASASEMLPRLTKRILIFSANAIVITSL